MLLVASLRHRYSNSRYWCFGFKGHNYLGCIAIYLLSYLYDSECQDVVFCLVKFLLKLVCKCLIYSTIRDVHVVDICPCIVIGQSKYIHVSDSVAYNLTLRSEVFEQDIASFQHFCILKTQFF